MITYIIITLFIMTIREIYANRGVSNISSKSWLWVAFAPITLPVTIGYAFYSAYKSVS